ncbi:MAG: flagellar motor protein MotB [Pseudomonadota bacterium]|jgi:chemotaxis protein MotB
MKSKQKEIIIYKKLKNKSEAPHHAGMWKVAYADFITAMMCFFLLMWLISTTPKDKLEGLAQYFANKQSKDSDVGEEDGNDHGLSKKAQPKELLNSTSGEQIFESDKFNLLSAEDKQSFINTMNNIKQDQVLQKFSENIVWDITSEGLRIQITDTNNRPMFRPNTSELAPYMRDILNAVANMIKNYPNYVAIAGHTASIQNTETNSIDYWGLSALRANEVRKFISGIVKSDQVLRIIGKADTEPMSSDNPYSPQNARITITLLKNGSVSKYQQSVPEKVFGPKSAK